MALSLTLLFPGQGSQYVGMGKVLCQESPSALEYFQEADKTLGYSLSQTCFEGPVETLKMTEHTQPAILTHSLALMHKVQELLTRHQCPVTRVLGHSVGEYAALVVAKVMTFSEAVKAVHWRGKFMQEAVPAGRGKMVAILRVPAEKILEACQQSSLPQSQVMPANYNEPQQTVISGHAEACDRAVQWLEKNWAEKFRAVELPVSAPFHSSLMEPAAEKLKGILNNIKFEKNILPYVANIDAKEYGRDTAPQTLRENLIRQVAGSVLWAQSIALLPSDTLCLEVGPGNVLKGLAKKINPQLKVLDMDNPQSFTLLEESLA